ncbi:MAG: Gfo/Idh/MocA family oxidoreductase [Arhodomonas sp.]|nr:Gfo/Idh/MocA family oxidoreductase [Arhodomonas sp.]
MTAPLRAAVVGVGYLGRFHARKYAELPDVELVAVVDVDADRAAALAAELDTEALSDHRLLPGRVDVASVVTPTDAHHEVAADLLNAGIHCLVEKPLTPTVEEGRELVALARRRGVVLQVGHLERFNPVVVGARPHVDGPLFIESHRVARSRRRGTEVSVVLDLMIHDIDLILELVAAPLRRIHANGVAVLSGDIDIANARLEFDNGCVANVTASRVSLKSERMLRMFQRRSYLALDLHNGSLEIRRKGDSSLDPEIPGIDSERHSFRRGDALRAEIEALLESIRTGDPPVVSGEEGLRALSTALEVTRQVRANATAGNLREAGGWVDE